MKMKQVVDKEQALKQLDLVFAGKGGEVQPLHFPVLARVYKKLQANEEITVDDFIILAVYRDTVRFIHLQTLNKDHPQWRKGTTPGVREYKGQHLKPRRKVVRSAATKAKIAEAQRQRHAKRKAKKN